MEMLPQDLTGKELDIIIETNRSDRYYYGRIKGMNMEKGKIYQYTVDMEIIKMW